MTVYAVVLIRNITDQEEYGRYVQGFMEIFSQYDGQILAVTESPTVIEGDWPYAQTVLLSFPNADALNLWYRSPEYQVLVQHRYRSSTSQIAMLPALGDSDPPKVPTQDSA